MKNTSKKVTTWDGGQEVNFILAASFVTRYVPDVSAEPSGAPWSGRRDVERHADRWVYPTMGGVKLFRGYRGLLQTVNLGYGHAEHRRKWNASNCGSSRRPSRMVGQVHTYICGTSGAAPEVRHVTLERIRRGGMS